MAEIISPNSEDKPRRIRGLHRRRVLFALSRSDLTVAQISRHKAVEYRGAHPTRWGLRGLDARLALGRLVLGLLLLLGRAEVKLLGGRRLHLLGLLGLLLAAAGQREAEDELVLGVVVPVLLLLFTSAAARAGGALCGCSLGSVRAALVLLLFLRPGAGCRRS